MARTKWSRKKKSKKTKRVEEIIGEEVENAKDISEEVDHNEEEEEVSHAEEGGHEEGGNEEVNVQGEEQADRQRHEEDKSSDDEEDNVVERSRDDEAVGAYNVTEWMKKIEEKIDAYDVRLVASEALIHEQLGGGFVNVVEESGEKIRKKKTKRGANRDAGVEFVETVSKKKKMRKTQG